MYYYYSNLVNNQRLQPFIPAKTALADIYFCLSKGDIIQPHIQTCNFLTVLLSVKSFINVLIIYSTDRKLNFRRNKSTLQLFTNQFSCIMPDKVYCLAVYLENTTHLSLRCLKTSALFPFLFLSFAILFQISLWFSLLSQ